MKSWSEPAGAELSNAGASGSPPLGCRDEVPEIDAQRVERLLLIRRLRQIVIGENLFSDPAWDLLLALYAADLNQKRHGIDELAAAAGLTNGQALRWTSALVERGLAQSGPGTADSTIELTAEGRASLRRFFQAASSEGLLL